LFKRAAISKKHVWTCDYAGKFKIILQCVLTGTGTCNHTHTRTQNEEVSTVIVKLIQKIVTDLHVFSTSEYENVVFGVSFVL
jgi:hypothetical protein